MSAVIKASAARSVHAFPKGLHTIANGAPKQSAEDERLAELRQEKEELEATLANLRTAAAEDRARAREEGRQEGLVAARREDDDRTAALREGIGAAVQTWNDRLDALDGLAALLARTALSRLFDEYEDHSSFVQRTLSRQLHRLRQEAVVAVRVSPTDFRDDVELAQLAAAAGAGSIRIVADPDLTAGDCRLDLQLGQVDLGLRAQWGQLSELLFDLSLQESAP